MGPDDGIQLQDFYYYTGKIEQELCDYVKINKNTQFYSGDEKLEGKIYFDLARIMGLP